MQIDTSAHTNLMTSIFLTQKIFSKVLSWFHCFCSVTVPGGCRSQGCHGYPTHSALVHRVVMVTLRAWLLCSRLHYLSRHLPQAHLLLMSLTVYIIQHVVHTVISFRVNIFILKVKPACQQTQRTDLTRFN